MVRSECWGRLTWMVALALLVAAGASCSGPEDTQRPRLDASGDAVHWLDMPGGPETRAVAHVVLVLLDGVRPDILALAHTPHMDRLIQEGAFSDQGWSQWPSNTLAGIPTVHTGAAPEVHDVTDWRGTIQAETLTQVFNEQGLRSALIGSDAIMGGYAAQWVTGYTYNADEAQVTLQAIEMWRANRPFFTFIYNPKPDAAGHASGHTSVQYRQAIESADVQIGRLIEALEDEGMWARTLMVITTDHGMTGNAHGYGYETDRLIFSIWRGPGVRQGHTIATDIALPAEATGRVGVGLHGLAAAPWSEATVTWDTQPAWEPAHAWTHVEAEGQVAWEATALVAAAWQAGRPVELGLAAETPEREEAAFFNTKEWYDAGSHPRLFVRFRGADGVVGSVAVAPVDDALLREAEGAVNFGDQGNFLIGRFQRSGEGRALLRFDLGEALPPGVEVVEASLQAWCWRRFPVGRGARQVAYHQVDVASTIAHLVGVRAPAQSSGAVILGLLADAAP